MTDPLPLKYHALLFTAVAISTGSAIHRPMSHHNDPWMLSSVTISSLQLLLQPIVLPCRVNLEVRVEKNFCRDADDVGRSNTPAAEEREGQMREGEENHIAILFVISLIIPPQKRPLFPVRSCLYEVAKIQFFND